MENEDKIRALMEADEHKLAVQLCIGLDIDLKKLLKKWWNDNLLFCDGNMDELIIGSLSFRNYESVGYYYYSEYRHLKSNPGIRCGENIDDMFDFAVNELTEL